MVKICNITSGLWQLLVLACHQLFLNMIILHTFDNISLPEKLKEFLELLFATKNNNQQLRKNKSLLVSTTSSYPIILHVTLN